MAKLKGKQTISAPHDHYFKMAMSDHRVAREFFESHLPNDLLPLFDLTHLTPQPGSYIDDMRQEAIADMLFKTKIMNEDAFLYLIADHQSTPDILMPFRVLKYITNIIDQHLKSSKEKTIPLVIPFVIYHGKKPWNFSTDINDLIAAPQPLVDAFFLKPFQFIDLNKIADEDLKEKIWSGIMELTLKHAFARDIMPYLHDIMQLLKQAEMMDGITLVEATLVYILDNTEVNDKTAFIDLVKHQMSPKIGEKIMTVAEQFRAEGIQQGIQQGIQEGIQEGIQKGRQQTAKIIAERMLSEGVAIELIAKITQLSIQYLNTLAVTE